MIYSISLFSCDFFLPSLIFIFLMERKTSQLTLLSDIFYLFRLYLVVIETRKNESISKDGGIAGDMMVHRVTSMASASSVSVDLIRVDSPASNPNNSLHPSLGMSSFRSNQGLGFSPGGLLVPSYTSSFSRTRRSSVQRLSPYSTPAETRHGKEFVFRSFFSRLFLDEYVLL